MSETKVSAAWFLLKAQTETPSSSLPVSGVAANAWRPSACGRITPVSVLVTSAKTLFPNKFRFTGPGFRTWTYLLTYIQPITCSHLVQGHLISVSSLANHAGSGLDKRLSTLLPLERPPPHTRCFKERGSCPSPRGPKLFPQLGWGLVFLNEIPSS